MENLELLEKKIDYYFKNKSLLLQALTHSSYANEKHIGANKDYERLEFLGDAVLQLVSSDYLLKTHPKSNEGQLSRMRADLVCERALSDRARHLVIGEHIILGKGEKLDGGADKDRILGNVIESIIGAIYKDSGFKSAEYFIINNLLHNVPITDTDYKTKLQVKLSGKTVKYKVLEEQGEAHELKFIVEGIIGNDIIGVGIGSTKKAAEQEAAREILKKLSLNETRYNAK